MPDEFGGIPIDEPQTDEFGGLAVAEPPRKSWLSTVFTSPKRPNGQPWVPPSPDESILGISPDIVPRGTTPLTSGLSAVGKTAAGLGQFITSPQGMAETAAVATPAAPVIMAKWAYDMARGGYKSTKAIVDELGQMANEALNKGIITQNQLGPAPQGVTTQEHIQSLAENAANAVAMGLGGTVLASHGLGRNKVAPTEPAVPEATPELPKAPNQQAFKLKNGDVISDPSAVAHFQLLDKYNINPETIESKGYTDPKGNYHSEVESPDLTRNLQEEKALLDFEKAKAPPSVAPAGESPTAPAVSAAQVPAVTGTEPAKAEPTPIRTTTQPELVGLGGAEAKEIPETGAGGEKYGVAERVRAERVQAGQVEPVPPGKGMSTQETIAMGRDIVRRDPEAGPRILAQFEADPKKAVSTEGISVVRAHGESLAAGARTIEETYGTESPQYQQAKEYLSDWDKRSKAMQTEWHKQGQAQQGETDIDTGSYTGLERARKQITGKDIPEPRKPRAKRIAAENKQAQQEVDVAGKKLNEQIAKKVVTDPEQAKVWELAKKYLDENKGLYGFDDLRNKIAADLGMKPDQVTKLLAKDKTTKRLADDLWNKQRNARRLKEQAKNWLRELDTPGYQKALASLPRIMFSISVGGHGFVALGTHAPIVAFQPRFWNAYFRNFGKMYKMVFNPAYYESQMADLVRRDNYEKARRAGLQNDPFKYEEYHTTALSDLVKSWIGEKNMNRVDTFLSSGNRGYGVLKLLRQDMFDQKYNQLPDSIRKQEGVNESLAIDINHATGVTEKAAPKGSNLLLFAPRLAGSRVMWLLGDPIRAVRTIANWKNATTAEKVFAKNQMREKGWVLGTFASLLAANQGFLTASGSKQKINGIPEVMGGAGFDPLAGDFMKFKALGGDIAYGGALLTMAKLPVRVATAILYDGKGSKYILEDERVDKVIGSYIRSQMSPFAGTVTDLALGRDYEERPLPSKLFGTVEQTGAVPKRLQAQGVDEPYNWPEFVGTKLPIPIAEGLKEGLRASGMPENQINPWLKGFAISFLMGATGTRITEDTREE